MYTAHVTVAMAPLSPESPPAHSSQVFSPWSRSLRLYLPPQAMLSPHPPSFQGMMVFPAASPALGVQLLASNCLVGLTEAPRQKSSPYCSWGSTTCLIPLARGQALGTAWGGCFVYRAPAVTLQLPEFPSEGAHPTPCQVPEPL